MCIHAPRFSVYCSMYTQHVYVTSEFYYEEYNSRQLMSTSLPMTLLFLLLHTTLIKLYHKRPSFQGRELLQFSLIPQYSELHSTVTLQNHFPDCVHNLVTYATKQDSLGSGILNVMEINVECEILSSLCISSYLQFYVCAFVLVKCRNSCVTILSVFYIPIHVYYGHFDDVLESKSTHCVLT